MQSHQARSRQARLGGARVDEDVVRVAVAQANDVAGHGVDGGGARVRQAALEPGRRLAVVLQEEVVQHRREARAHLQRWRSAPLSSQGVQVNMLALQCIMSTLFAHTHGIARASGGER